LDDGDATLLSKDGKLFKVHAHMLKKASTHFKDKFAWQNVRGAPIPMGQDSATLEVLLRLLYPNETQPPIPSTELLVSVLQATKDLGITSFVVRTELAAHIDAEPHPLRAWALATAYDYPAARRNAVERYLKADSDFLNDVPLEMRLVAGMQVCELMRLIGAKDRALQAAKNAISENRWSCYQCENGQPRPSYFGDARPLSMSECCSPQPFDKELEPSSGAPNVAEVRPIWRRAFLTRTATMNPFAPEATSEMHFELCATMASDCQECRTSFSKRAARQGRDRLREDLKSIFSATLEEIAPVRVCLCFPGLLLIASCSCESFDSCPI
jgi:hypothetical protein